MKIQINDKDIENRKDTKIWTDGLKMIFWIVCVWGFGSNLHAELMAII